VQHSVIILENQTTISSDAHAWWTLSSSSSSLSKLEEMLLFDLFDLLTPNDTFFF